MGGPGPLGDLTPARFLAEHWQKRPLLVRGAFGDFDPPLDGDELAGLACDPDVESRIVVSEPGPRYMLREGPFEAEDFAALGDRDWTLLVQDVDKQLPELAPFLDRFSFIPSWRIDDLMISWAADGGSVGPHMDRYDVFLYQARGERHWRIGAPDPGAPALPDNELHILADFKVTDEWTLGPGDLLYLPPGVPHWGVAKGPCITWSIGFRAPAVDDIVAVVLQRLGEDVRYSDPDLTLDEAADGRLSGAAVARARAALERELTGTGDGFARRFGELVTAPKPWLHCVPAPVPLTREALAERVAGGTTLTRDPRARMVWLVDDGPVLCADGESLPVAAGLEPLLRLLCGSRAFPPDTLRRYLGDPDAMSLLTRLYAGGQIVEAPDE